MGVCVEFYYCYRYGYSRAFVADEQCAEPGADWIESELVVQLRRAG